jgi:hypothetical protein
LLARRESAYQFYLTLSSSPHCLRLFVLGGGPKWRRRAVKREELPHQPNKNNKIATLASGDLII